MLQVASGIYVIEKQSSLSLLALYSILASGGNLAQGIKGIMAKKKGAWQNLLGGGAGLALSAIPAPGAAKAIGHVLSDPKAWAWATQRPVLK